MAAKTPTNWVAVGGLLAVGLGMCAGLAAFVFPGREDLHSLDIRVSKTEQVDIYQAQELTRHGAQLENIDARQRRMSSNIDKLLMRFRVNPDPPAQLRTLPPAPPAPPSE